MKLKQEKRRDEIKKIAKDINELIYSLAVYKIQNEMSLVLTCFQCIKDSSILDTTLYYTHYTYDSLAVFLNIFCKKWVFSYIVIKYKCKYEYEYEYDVAS